MVHNAQVIGLVAVALAVGIRRTERGLIDALEGAGAVTPETATTLPLTNWLKKQLFRRLLNGGAVGETQEMRQYLNVVGYAAYRKRRMWRGLIAAAVVVAIGLAFYFVKGHA